MTEKTNEKIQIHFYENPFKKNIIALKSQNFGPVEQKLIIHHKRNLRKSMNFDSKEEFDKTLNEKEVFNNLCKNPINKINQNGNKNNTGIRNIAINKIFIKKGEYPEFENEKVEVKDIKNVDFGNNCFLKRAEENKEIKKEKKDDGKIFYNPFKTNNNGDGTNLFNNPSNFFAQEKINKSNPFLNPFRNIDNIPSNNNAFINNSNNNPFTSTNNKNNPESLNPFINTKDNIFNNLFQNNDPSNPFISNINNHRGNPFLGEGSDDEEEIKNIQEEVKIEKDEAKLKNLKEVEIIKSDKFYETEIDNLQFLEKENGKNKYTSKGSGIFSLQKELDEKGKTVGIFTLRESSTKNIKIQGIIIDSTSAEKAKTKNGVEFIFIKNIIVKYSKYDSDKIIHETKMTFLRIRAKKEEVDEFLNKTKEFFNLVKK